MSMIFKDNKTASSVINILIIILGFLGGSYMPISLIKSTTYYKYSMSINTYILGKYIIIKFKHRTK